MTLLKKLLLPTLIVLFPAAVLAGQSDPTHVIWTQA